MMINQTIRTFGVELRPLTADLLETVRQWRNHPEVARHMLDQTYITEAMQQDWFARLQPDPRRACFIIYYRDEAIGVANLTALDASDLRQASSIEAGFYLGPNRYRGTLLAFLPALALNDYCFNQPGCRELIAHVKPENTAAFRFNETLGYRRITEPGEPGELIAMRLAPSAHQQARDKLRRFART